VLEAFKTAADSGAEVKIVYDRRGKAHVQKPGKKKRYRVWEATEPAAAAAGRPAAARHNTGLLPAKRSTDDGLVRGAG